MGRTTRIFTGMSLVLLSVFAQAQVQWLRYRTSADVGNETSASVNRYYRRFEQTRPQDIACPEFKSDNPLFIKWQTPMDESGFRWIAMDRSSPYGMCDLLYIDSDGDGRLDDETACQGRRQDQYDFAFDPLPVYLKDEDGPITYHLVCQFYSYDADSTYLMISSGGYYEGTVAIDGTDVPCLLVDSNSNGTFDDSSENFNADRIVLGPADHRQSFFVGRYLEYSNALHRLEIARDGAFAGVTPAPDVPYGVVQVPKTLTAFAAGGVNGLFEKTPVDGQVKLPEGTYRVYRWELKRKDDKGKDWTLSGNNFPKKETFTVAAAQAVTMDVGEPVYSRLTVQERQGQFYFNQELRGKHDESISLLRDGRQPAAPKVQIRSKTGDYDRTFSLEYG